MGKTLTLSGVVFKDDARVPNLEEPKLGRRGVETALELITESRYRDGTVLRHFITPNQRRDKRLMNDVRSLIRTLSEID